MSPGLKAVRTVARESLQSQFTINIDLLQLYQQFLSGDGTSIGAKHQWWIHASCFWHSAFMKKLLKWFCWVQVNVLSNVMCSRWHGVMNHQWQACTSSSLNPSKSWKHLIWLRDHMILDGNLFRTSASFLPSSVMFWSNRIFTPISRSLFCCSVLWTDDIHQLIF